VAAIGSRIDAVTRAVSVRALIDNADEALKPGMFLLVELGVSIRHQAVIIPEEAVVANGTQQYVFIVDEGQARQSSVELGQRMVGEVEVVSGVLAGEAIIVGGVQKVRDGASVAPRAPATEAVAAQ
jgi:membrane fusion protein (multidrug efflux system)